MAKYIRVGKPVVTWQGQGYVLAVEGDEHEFATAPPVEGWEKASPSKPKTKKEEGE